MFLAPLVLVLLGCCYLAPFASLLLRFSCVIAQSSCSCLGSFVLLLGLLALLLDPFVLLLVGSFYIVVVVVFLHFLPNSSC